MRTYPCQHEAWGVLVARGRTDLEEREGGTDDHEGAGADDAPPGEVGTEAAEEVGRDAHRGVAGLEDLNSGPARRGERGGGGGGRSAVPLYEDSLVRECCSKSDGASASS